MYKILKYKSKLQTATTNVKKQIYKSKLNYYNQLGGDDKCYCGCENEPSASAATACICGASGHEHTTALKTRTEAHIAFGKELPIFNEPELGNILYRSLGKSEENPFGYSKTDEFKCPSTCYESDHTKCFIKKYKGMYAGSTLYIEGLIIQSFIDLNVLLLENQDRLNMPSSWLDKFQNEPFLSVFNLKNLIIEKISGISELPETLSKLKYLRILGINNLNISNLCDLPKLTHLYCNNTNIENIPSTFTELKVLMCPRKMKNLPNTLTKLEILDCVNCNEMTTIPNTFTQLRKLNCSYCDNITNIPNTFTNLTELDCTECSLINTIPKELINLKKIKCDGTNIQFIDTTDMMALIKVIGENDVNVTHRPRIIHGTRLMLPVT